MKVAIVGAGVSGMVAAHLLHPHHEITVFEAGPRAGGHANTVRVDTPDETHYVDTGFVVFNDRNYPSFQRLLDELGVASQPSNMSFGVSDELGDFEYNGASPNGLFAKRSHLAKPWFHRMLLDLYRFNRDARELCGGGDSDASELCSGGGKDSDARELCSGGGKDSGARELCSAGGEDMSLGQWLSERDFSEAFVQRLIVPQVCAVWSTSPRQMWSFPARFFAEFLNNHGMLGFRERPRWLTVTGGSERYVEALADPWRHQLRLATPVQNVRRELDGVFVKPRGGEEERFDEVVIAAHSDQALELLGDPSEREREILAALPYQPSEAVLHTDVRMLPRRRRAWASWNYHLLEQPSELPTVTYHMNRLQSLSANCELCVTLNRTQAIDPAKVIRVIPCAHPVYTAAGIRAQARRAEISGRANRTHYCGAYWGWGFHEDGVRSALAVVKDFGVEA